MKLINAKLILLNLGRPNVFISLYMKVLIGFYIKNLNTFLYKECGPDVI